MNGLLALLISSSLLTTTAEPLDSAGIISMPLHEVSVSAIKQAPLLDSEPIASTTISESTLERMNITTFQDISTYVPNFYMPEYGSRITSSMYIRGLGARIDQPAMGMNIDNIPVLNKNDYDVDLFDIERIEVLRGPQSTLFGRNAMGGVINVYTISPMRYQGLRLLEEWSSFDTWRTAMGLYHKFHPTFGIGLDLHAYNTKGQHTNLNTATLHPQQSRKADQAEQYNAKLKLAWQPRQSLEINNVVSFTYNKQGGYPYEYVKTGEINYNDTCYYNRTSVSEGLTIQYRGNGYTISSITGLRYMNDDMQLDNDFTPKSYFTLNQRNKELSLTQDFVVSGQKGKYGWLGGLFGFVKHTRMNAPVEMLKDGINELILDNITAAMKNAGMPLDKMPPHMQPTWNSDRFPLSSNFTLPNWGLAIYHESSYTTGAWDIAAALRLDYEHAAMFYNTDVNTGMSVMGIPIVADIHNRGHLKQSFLELLPKLTVSYTLPMPSKSTVYASIAKGYKAGGYNTQMFSNILQQDLILELMKQASGYMPPHVQMPDFGEPSDVEAVTSYKPEHSWNYEVGAHISCMDGKIHTDLDVFYMDIRNQQLTVFPDGKTTGRMMTNAGRSRSFGAELAITALPSDRWTAHASYGYTNAKFLSYIDGPNNYKGKTVPYAPAHTMYAAVEYNQPLPMWWFNGISFEINTRGVGPIYWDEANEHRQNFYALVGASVRLNLSKVSVDFWGRNILNKDYNTFYFKSMGNSFLQRGDRRTFGVTLRYIM